MENAHKPYGPYERWVKRPLDFTLALMALIVLSPLLLILTVTGAITMHGNPFFVQRRPGRISKKTGQEKIFSLIKFRTMSNAKDKDGNLLPDEKRLNKYGMILRSTSLDELPELINIIKGDMAIVGPRPQLVRDMVFMTEEQRHRHDVRQGLTGLAQVNGRNNICWERKIAFDLQYIERITFFDDIRIALKTIKRVFEHNGVSKEGMATVEDYGDWLLQNNVITQASYEKKMHEAERIYKGIYV